LRILTTVPHPTVAAVSDGERIVSWGKTILIGARQPWLRGMLTESNERRTYMTLLYRIAAHCRSCQGQSVVAECTPLHSHLDPSANEVKDGVASFRIDVDAQFNLRAAIHVIGGMKLFAVETRVNLFEHFAHRSLDILLNGLHIELNGLERALVDHSLNQERTAVM
jgi:hypothetical protein